MKHVLGLVCAIALGVAIDAGDARSAPGSPGSAACDALVIEPSVNAIVREVFEEKGKKLSRSGLPSRDFWEKNRNIEFVVCNNMGGYDTFLYEQMVIFDYKMIGFLFSQSRAFILGRYISLDRQFDVHADLVSQFVKQGPELSTGPLAILERKALALGVGKTGLEKFYADEQFKQREQNLFLISMYFLTMHERCHVALDHPVQVQAMKGLSDGEISRRRQLLELAADRCALDIINADEAQFRSSPISFFGVLMTVATQSITANLPSLRSDQSHPSTRYRLAAATEISLAYIAKSGSPNAERYMLITKATADYFDDLLRRFEVSP
ncbi:hypothetical protein FHP25_35935 [Vineibacter terrae]|uniref:Uncharacterized protein n=1 Tax=Vineibacter terrae TaxID=2586908 RepID=A0A5C8PAQ2_9HYPH|nr:hypothetical protein [Vineibacter terrae]TXL70115.1 hypothetical protein FHP25_35935 [Vineibacter terrae]